LLKARFFNLHSEEQAFKVIFAEQEVIEDPESEEEQVEEVIEDESTETQETTTPGSGQGSDDKDEDTLQESGAAEETLSPSEINGWDGWKILLEKLGLDIDLPKPSDDPNYVPSPPKVSASSVSATGTVTINFSEPVFELKDMTKRLIGRRLAQKPFLDIKVIPGENSDLELLKYTTETKWVNNKEFTIDVSFSNPTAISA